MSSTFRPKSRKWLIRCCLIFWKREIWRTNWRDTIVAWWRSWLATTISKQIRLRKRRRKKILTRAYPTIRKHRRSRLKSRTPIRARSLSKFKPKPADPRSRIWNEMSTWSRIRDKQWKIPVSRVQTLESANEWVGKCVANESGMEQAIEEVVVMKPDKIILEPVKAG